MIWTEKICFSFTIQKTITNPWNHEKKKVWFNDQVMVFSFSSSRGQGLLGNDRDGHGLDDGLDVVAVERVSGTFLLQPANTSSRVTAGRASAGWAEPRSGSDCTCRGRRWQPRPSSQSSGLDWRCRPADTRKRWQGQISYQVAKVATFLMKQCIYC